MNDLTYSLLMTLQIIGVALAFISAVGFLIGLMIGAFEENIAGWIIAGISPFTFIIGAFTGIYTHQVLN